MIAIHDLIEYKNKKYISLVDEINCFKMNMVTNISYQEIALKACVMNVEFLKAFLERCDLIKDSIQDSDYLEIFELENYFDESRQSFLFENIKNRYDLKNVARELIINKEVVFFPNEKDIKSFLQNTFKTEDELGEFVINFSKNTSMEMLENYFKQIPEIINSLFSDEYLNNKILTSVDLLPLAKLVTISGKNLTDKQSDKVVSLIAKHEGNHVSLRDSKRNGCGYLFSKMSEDVFDKKLIIVENEQPVIKTLKDLNIREVDNEYDMFLRKNRQNKLTECLENIKEPTEHVKKKI